MISRSLERNLELEPDTSRSSMLNYQSLKQNPQAFKKLTSITPTEFDHLFEKVSLSWMESECQRLDRPDRQRARGGGSDYKLPLRERLLMTLMWLRLYLTTEALGILFGVNKSTVSRNTRRLLPVLDPLCSDTLDWPDPPKRGQGKNVGQALQTHPDLCPFVDAAELARPHAQNLENIRRMIN